MGHLSHTKSTKITENKKLNEIFLRDILKMVSNSPKNYVKLTQKLHEILIKII